MARATRSFPTPLSPRTSTVASVPATFSMTRRTVLAFALQERSGANSSRYVGPNHDCGRPSPSPGREKGGIRDPKRTPIPSSTPRLAVLCSVVRQPLAMGVQGPGHGRPSRNEDDIVNSILNEMEVTCLRFPIRPVRISTRRRRSYIPGVSQTRGVMRSRRAPQRGLGVPSATSVRQDPPRAQRSGPKSSRQIPTKSTRFEA